MYTHHYRLLRIIDAGRRPSMGLVYCMLEDAKNEINIACNRKGTLYQSIIDIIKKQYRGRLASTLNYLNSYYYYKDKTSKITHVCLLQL